MSEIKQEFIYFIQATECENRIKIGVSNDAKKRFYNLQVANASKLELLGYIPGNKILEKEWHKRFDKFRIRGEWFSPHITLMDAIKFEVNNYQKTQEQKYKPDKNNKINSKKDVFKINVGDSTVSVKPNVDLMKKIIDNYSLNFKIKFKSSTFTLEKIKIEAEKFKEIHGKYPSARSGKWQNFDNSSWEMANNWLRANKLSLSILLLHQSPKFENLSLNIKILKLVNILYFSKKLNRGGIGRKLINNIIKMPSGIEEAKKYGIDITILDVSRNYRQTLFELDQFIEQHAKFGFFDNRYIQ